MNHEERSNQINAANHKGDPLEGTAASAASTPQPLNRADPRHNPVVAFATSTEFRGEELRGEEFAGEGFAGEDVGGGVGRRGLIDFSTRFSFVINSFGQSEFGDGLAFFLSPFNDSKPPYPIGGNFGLFRNGTLTDSTVPTVAVEFDTYSNKWDPKYVHVGIDVNSIVSNVTAQWQADDEIKAGGEATAWVSYNSITHNLSALVSYASDPASAAGIFLIVDLRDVLPEKVGMGFSASTGGL
ncbi:hypothetical protein ZIOFF_051592 [Zingiber officinale]|uniref:Legume lectin domain-containing protein n=1 Tax=Zingiber officinale TaxID=94328 RepID=A0A8J5FM72_ZINOF|nr:hypothetical protein ZIOFF_051592 [Zingiber officinale]